MHRTLTPPGSSKFQILTKFLCTSFKRASRGVSPSNSLDPSAESQVPCSQYVVHDEDERMTTFYDNAERTTCELQLAASMLLDTLD